MLGRLARRFGTKAVKTPPKTKGSSRFTTMAAVGTTFLSSAIVVGYNYDPALPWNAQLENAYRNTTQSKSEEDEVEESYRAAPIHEMAVVTMVSGRRFRVHVKSDDSVEQVAMLVRELGATPSDKVVHIVFEDSTEPVKVEESKDTEEKVFIPEDGEVPESTWPTSRPKGALKTLSAEKKKEWELAALTTRLNKLQQEMKTGTREIDDIQEDMKRVQAEIDQVAPAKKYFKWF